MTIRLMATLVLAAALPLSGAMAQTAESGIIEFAGASWRLAGNEARIETYQGREVMLVDGRIWADDIDLADFVMEFDMLSQPTGFVGVSFRALNDRNFEDFYMRNGAQDQIDAVQYMPVINGVTGWQMYIDGRFNAAVHFEPGAWTHVKLVVIGDRMDLYIDSNEPVMHVPDLQTDAASGAIGLRAGLGSQVRYANMVIRPAGPDDQIIGEVQSFEGMPGLPAGLFSTDLPETLIRRFEVSGTFEESRFAGVTQAEALPTADDQWQSLDVDINGAANLARVNSHSQLLNSAMVRTRLTADSAGVRELRFGYSDRIRLYLNGQLLYAAGNGWQARDPGFYGRVRLHDTVGLPLREGENELIAVVSETFGGWAFMADLPDRTGVSVE
ncbi:family 16 glycoside hydrolase [Hyphobacterium sp. HN65]|uniref:Family 16 glycoside hydrolase n=1 Tax=Hyphobacterium lacteum TaxID=3116575 RepID=A0ABU7LPT8_9PROT|nr:family 16 glycoside hydrolase [Hyphobacterium sp. HN65]MEE2525915.1 family 16 glycoside hydrolase [Hyphobacterium sp. HN65]